jgi:hypothetical protein
MPFAPPVALQNAGEPNDDVPAAVKPGLLDPPPPPPITVTLIAFKPAGLVQVPGEVKTCMM